MTRQLISGVLAIMFASTVSFAQSAMTDEALRPLVAVAVKIGAGNADKTIDALDKAVKATWGDFDKNPTFLNRFDSTFLAGAFGPYLTFRQALRERVRKLEPIEGLALVPDEVQVGIFPNKMTAPDIVKVVVQRDGAAVDPVRSTLALETFKNGFGQSVQRHSGMVVFPASAFAPGGVVTVTLIPETGDNIVTKIDAKQLIKFK